MYLFRSGMTISSKKLLVLRKCYLFWSGMTISSKKLLVLRKCYLFWSGMTISSKKLLVSRKCTCFGVEWQFQVVHTTPKQHNFRLDCVEKMPFFSLFSRIYHAFIIASIQSFAFKLILTHTFRLSKIFFNNNILICVL